MNPDTGLQFGRDHAPVFEAHEEFGWDRDGAVIGVAVVSHFVTNASRIHQVTSVVALDAQQFQYGTGLIKMCEIVFN